MRMERSQIPSEATFSRVFAEFAESRLCERVHEALIKRTLSDHLFGHISQDSTEIEAREKPAVKVVDGTKIHANAAIKSLEPIVVDVELDDYLARLRLK